MIKKVLYQNSSGFQAAFYTYKLPLCESIDASGVGADFTSDSLAFSDGQITTYKKLKPRTIPADFALSIIDEKEAERKLRMANPEIAVFRVHFDAMQQSVSDMIKVLEQVVVSGDTETADKLRRAAKAVLENAMIRIENI